MNHGDTETQRSRFRWRAFSVPLCLCGSILGLFAADPAKVISPTDEILPIVPAGFQAQLFAREPAVRNPCAMAFDARGRLFVGQGPQYRNPKPDTPGDTVVMLVDVDGDGVAEAAKTFATGLNCVQGLAWHGRDLWVANAPDLTIVRDLDGDDVADEYVLVYTDLGNIEHGIHGLNWAPDGKLYMSKGNSKGLMQPGRIAPKPFRDLWDVTAPAGTPDFPPPRTFKRADYKATYHDPQDDWGRMGGILRCDDLGANLEIVSRGYRNPFDIGFDSGFNWLGTDNDQSEGDRIFMSFRGANFGWAHGWSAHWTGEGHLPTVPISGKVFTGSGTGVLFSDSPQMPAHLRGVWFINDWLRRTTFVYRSRWVGALLQPEGGKWEPFIQGGRALFNPVEIEHGPEGALYLTGWGAKLGADIKDGQQLNEGRVFRVTPPGFVPAKWTSTKRAKPLAQWTFAELAEDLGTSIPVWRSDAQDELVRRGAAVRADLLAQLTRGGLTTVQETWLLWTLGRLESQNRAIDEWFATRGHTLSLNAKLQSLRILAHRIREWQHEAKLPEFVVSAIGDSEPRVRFEAVQAIGQARQRALADAVWALAAKETDRIAFYAAWHTLLELEPQSAIREKLTDRRAGVRRAALLALLDRGALDETAVRSLLNDLDASTASLAALWLAKRDGNPLVVIEPAAGDFTDSMRVKITPGLKPSTVRFTLDGSEPTLKTVSSRDDLLLRKTTTVKAALFIDGKKVGPTAESTYRKREPAAEEKIELTPPTTPTTLVAVLPLLKNGDAKRGRAVFFTAGCAACHAVGSEGGAFGPDLTELAERGNVERVIRAILEPNVEITEGFALLNVSTVDGRSFAGRLQEETSRQLALMQPDGQTVRVPKADIAKRESLHVSPMPPFDRVLAAQPLADLVTWLVGPALAAVPPGSQHDNRNGMPTSGSPTATAFAAELRDDRLVLTDHARPVASYVFKDAQTFRPHLQNLHAPGGTRISRTHPPAAGEPNDHATMHPGAWFAFGSINGEDFWRNKARIEHERFIDPPTVQNGVLSFATASRLLTTAGQSIASQTLRVSIARQGDAYLFTCETTLKSGDGDLVFGEQEEMGFGVRLATPLIEKNGGKVVNSNGLAGAKQAWGKVADWCSYTHTIDGRVLGAAIFTSPKNPRRSWWHARDYGLMVANAFGKRVLTAGSDGNLTVKRGEALTLRYGLLVFDAQAVPDFATAYKSFIAAP